MTDAQLAEVLTAFVAEIEARPPKPSHLVERPSVLPYYGRYTRSALETICRHLNRILLIWAMRKFKRLKGRQARAKLFFEKIARARPRCFEHWRLGMAGAFA
jgi:hypothetical protein